MHEIASHQPHVALPCCHTRCSQAAGRAACQLHLPPRIWRRRLPFHRPQPKPCAVRGALAFKGCRCCCQACIVLCCLRCVVADAVAGLSPPCTAASRDKAARPLCARSLFSHILLQLHAKSRCACSLSRLPTSLCIFLALYYALLTLSHRFVKFLGILTLESFTSAALGLSVGAAAPTADAAVAIGPAVMLVWIIFGGYYCNAENIPR